VGQRNIGARQLPELWAGQLVKPRKERWRRLRRKLLANVPETLTGRHSNNVELRQVHGGTIAAAPTTTTTTLWVQHPRDGVAVLTAYPNLRLCPHYAIGIRADVPTVSASTSTSSHSPPCLFCMRHHKKGWDKHTGIGASSKTQRSWKRTPPASSRQQKLRAVTEQTIEIRVFGKSMG
jgi:hypothetical protein